MCESLLDFSFKIHFNISRILFNQGYVFSLCHYISDNK